MHTTRSRDTLNSILLIVSAAKNRVLTEEEKDELARLCILLQEGVPGQSLYNYAARAYSSRLQGSGLLEGGSSPEIDELAADGESMKLKLR